MEKKQQEQPTMLANKIPESSREPENNDIPETMNVSAITRRLAKIKRMFIEASWQLDEIMEESEGTAIFCEEDRLPYHEINKMASRIDDNMNQLIGRSVGCNLLFSEYTRM